MSQADDRERLQKLRETVKHHQKKYHTEDNPEISDQAYDALLRDLTDLEIKLEGKASSVSSAVGGEVNEAFAKVKHRVPQWSFDNIFNEAELQKWEDRIKRLITEADQSTQNLDYVVEHKIDGLKLVVEYENGLLQRASTRGDGVTGENVTHTARTIANLPEKLKQPVNLICVGEVWLSEKAFAKINKEREKNGEPLFANPRNAAAGSLRQLDASITAKRDLAITVYDLDLLELNDTKLTSPASQWEELQLLRSLGLPVSKHSKVCKNVQAIQEYYDKWSKQHESLAYAVDGVVIKVNPLSLQRLLGYTAKSPRFGVAYKFPAEEATTVVEDIQLQVGRTGVITPVAHLRPVLIDGSMVSRATLHNEDNIKRLDVRVGDTVVLRKAGDIIPEILSVVMSLRPKKTKPYRFPAKVVECGGDGSIERIPGEAAYRCVSNESGALHRHRLYYFVSKSALDIDGLGPKLIDLFLDHNLISSYADLFTLNEGDLKDLPGFKEKSAQNIIEAIEAAKQVPLHRLLIGLSINNVGEETARLIADKFGSLKAIQTASVEEIAAIYGVGEVVAQSVHDWFQNEANQTILEELLPHLDIQNPAEESLPQKLAGQTFVLTGTMENFTRGEAQDAIRRLGGSVSSSVSKKTSYVVVGAEPGSKAEKAKELGVKIISEAEFKKLVTV